jgi:hypothetical protein
MSLRECSDVRDLLPLAARGQLLPHEAGQVDEHVVSCAECLLEQRLVGLLLGTAASLPGGLEARVLLAVRGSAAAASRFTHRRVALAAVLAAAVIGGSLALGRGGAWMGAGAGVLAADEQNPAVSWAVAFDPLFQGASALQQLSVEELELILAELDS